MQTQQIQQLMRKDLNLLLVFNAIVETGSVSKAADKLALSQPATSHALNRLRECFGDPLFVRAKAGLAPTEFAQRLIEPVDQVLAQLFQIFEQPHFEALTSERRFRIAASDFTIATLMPPLLQKFSKIAPLVGFEMQGMPKNAFEQLDNGQIELMLAVLPSVPSTYRAVELLQDHFVGVVHQDHPLALLSTQQPPSLADYLRYPHLSVAFNEELRDQTDHQLEALGAKRYIRAHLPSFISGLNSLAKTELIMTIPKRLGQAFIQRFELVEFELPMASPPQSYYLIWHKRTEEDRGLQWLRGQIQGYFAQQDSFLPL